MSYQQQQPSQPTPPIQPVQTSQAGFNFSITPSNIMSAFSTATSVMNNIGSLKSKMDSQQPQPAPARPAPVPSQSATLPNPLIPQ